ncbi:sensor histidine kinase [Streptomyces sp. UNOC14_S4]|uniref:sensor histidine kinase n=1 Tax=Streptomyces sp. UNOC14_S4 TaxID=2872340 RepID=UPI001E644280|nr:sensor histidine kinase [Streptomyces sp. UNOC14_S4]MCC3767481.1 sensor histidine kinase [Streptomyces sp. UNOC14_S4]
MGERKRKRLRDWRKWSRVEQVDFYTRVTVCVVPFLFPATNGFQLLGGPSLVLGWVLLGISLVHCTHHIVLSRRCLDHYLRKQPVPWRGLAFSTVLYVAFIGLYVVKVLVEGAAHITTSGLMLQASSLIVFGSFSVVTRIRRYLGVSLLVAVALTAAIALMGGTVVGAVIIGAFTVFSALWSLSVMRTSAWFLAVLWELEEARTAQAKLAVAEERLRFSRDLHDVMGRNLAVIALKSELAVQLARRGSADALQHMEEVQRIARDSQREVRAVVRGYREADLHTELAGARGVLVAAGIECRIDDATKDALPQPVQAALAWVVREATTNVLRHADARRCAVRMRITDGTAVLVMENDGVPEKAPQPGTGGSGLAGLTERLAALDGTLTAERREPRMFRVKAEIPLAGTDAGAAEEDGARSRVTAAAVPGGEA